MTLIFCIGHKWLLQQ